MFTFQEIISKLTKFWSDKGCVIHQPYDVEVGAGTFNPTTFLRCLGPEPYAAAFVETSRRPQDGRYGQNPNRFQLFHQLQVIIKPSPIDIQETYIQSLEAIGFDLSKHDIRFVHDDWESPTLGAWGLGWEVWIDGMEITQYTYFQAVGGVPVKPVCVELALGLERLTMLLQNVDTFFDIKWNDTLTFKDLVVQSEIEWSIHNFDEATIEMWQRHFDDYEREAKHLLGKNLPFPAYDFVLKATHAFNILEARGVLSVTERTGFISRIRKLAHAAAAKFIETREKEGFPLLKKEEKQSIVFEKTPPPQVDPEKTDDFLLEIGSEQLPATFVPIGMQSLETTIKALLIDHRLSFKEVKTYATPRRLAIVIKDLIHGTSSKSIEKKGPPIDRAFDEKGNLSPQGKGFFKSIGAGEDITLSQIKDGCFPNIEIRSQGKFEYIFAKIEQEGFSTFAILQEHLPKCILDISFPKKMRWSDLDIEYARPIRWIVALFGQNIIPFALGNIHSGNTSRGHAQICSEEFTISSPEKYHSELKNHYVLADVDQRKEEILRQLSHIEKRTESIALKKNRVLNEVLHLVEWPELTEAPFDENFLKAPAEVLISEMVEHQRYFPLADEHGALKNQFVITADNQPNDIIRKGNQKVLSARLADGVFLYEQDLKHTLDHFVEKLKTITFQRELGSMYDKSKRIKELSILLCTFFPESDEKKASRAAELCKADLSTLLVGEFPNLQGTIGKDYALHQGEDREVAEAIEEHWWPNFEGGPLPSTQTGSILSIADKLDNLIGYFSVGLKPTSSSDPYALRRQTLGTVKILIENSWSLDLPTFLDKAYHAFPKLRGELHLQKELTEEIITYLTTRARTVYEDYGFKKDEIEAALCGKLINPFDQFRRIQALSTFRKSGDDFTKLLQVYKRAKGQLQMKGKSTYDPKLLIESQEKTLASEIAIIEQHWDTALTQANYLKAFELLSTLHSPLADLFDNVKILADDTQIRENRLALLQKVFFYFSELLDFSKIQEHR